MTKICKATSGKESFWKQALCVANANIEPFGHNPQKYVWWKKEQHLMKTPCQLLSMMVCLGLVSQPIVQEMFHRKGRKGSCSPLIASLWKIYSYNFSGLLQSWYNFLEVKLYFRKHWHIDLNHTLPNEISSILWLSHQHVQPLTQQFKPSARCVA